MTDDSDKNINFLPISKKEKAQLKRRITGSLYGYVKRRSRFRSLGGVTLVVFLALITAGIFFTSQSHQPASDIEEFVKTVETHDANDKVRLILSDANNVELKDNESFISYSKTGENVQIGKDYSVNQKTSDKEKTVFNTLIVPFGKRSEILLSDGTKVWLNSGSKLTFPAVFASNKREVYLEGEAVFEVTHRSKQPFLVKSENQEIEVLGTLFNVSNYKDDVAIYTVLESGSVKIHLTGNKLFENSKTIKLSPGTLATVHKSSNDINTETVSTAPYFSWREGIFIFKNDSLQSIMKKLSRYYNVEVVINDQKLANETFSGHLDLKESIEHVMETIKATQSSEFNYQITKDNKLIFN